MHFDLKSLIAMSRCSRLIMIFLNTCSCSLANLTRKYSSDSKSGMSTAAASVAARRSRNANYLDSLDVPAYVLNHIIMGQVWPEGKTISNSVMKRAYSFVLNKIHRTHIEDTLKFPPKSFYPNLVSINRDLVCSVFRPCL